MIEHIKNLFPNGFDTYSTLITIIAINMVIFSMYNRIKYLCLKKAAEKVAEIEQNTELTGSEKFAQVVLWINEDLPKLFRNKFFNTLIKKLVQFAYDNSKEYTENYIKRRTGYDLSTLIENIYNKNLNDSNDAKSDISTNNNDQKEL